MNVAAAAGQPPAPGCQQTNVAPLVVADNTQSLKRPLLTDVSYSLKRPLIAVA
jgi:hypothetical protein